MIDQSGKIVGVVYTKLGMLYKFLGHSGKILGMFYKILGRSGDILGLF